MKPALAWMLLCVTALAQRPEPGVPPGWTVYVVHAPWCAPCQRFRSDYRTITEFRHALETAYAVKNCDWDRGNDQRFARRFGISSLPGFIVFRDGVHQYSFVGYTGDWRAFCEKLNLDVDGAGQAPRSGTEGPARPITPAERALPEIADLRAELDRLRRQMTEAAKQKPTETTSGALPAEKPARPDIPSGTGSPPLPPVLSIPAVEEPAGGGSAVAEDWAKVGAAALAILAPQVALPAGAIGAAATVFQMLRRRRQQMQAQQPRQQTVVERPVVINTDTLPPPAQVVTSNQYVPVERDTHREAWAFASSAYVKKYPGSEAMIGALNHMMEQYISPQQKAG